jgi:hypothetical protein
MTQDIEIFANYCVFMRSIYLHTRELFETSSAEDKALMKRTAGTFFGDLNRVLNESVILQVCKITDPAHDNRNNDNHTIAFLLEHYDFSSDPSILEPLKALQASMRAFREKLLPARHGPVAELVGIEGGVVSGVFNLESSGVGAPDWRPRPEEH